MTRTLNLSLIGLALVCGLSLRADDAFAQPRPRPTPAVPVVPPPPPPQLPPLPAPPALPPAPGGYSGDFDVHIDWDFDMNGLGDSVRESVRVATESARQALADMKLRMEDFKGDFNAQVGVGVGVGKGSYIGREAKDDAWYRQAREYIDRGRYEQALNTLEQIIGLAGSSHADAAMYWKAYSLGRLQRNADALNVLVELQKRFPDSRWLKDAKALEVETRQASGQAVPPDAQNDEELKLLALRGLMRTDPDRAMPMIEKLMAGNGSIRLRENALFVLSQSQSPKARDIISTVARTGNPDLQAKAIRYLGVMNGDTRQNQTALTEIYRGSNDAAVKRSVIDALSGRSSAKALADLARIEKDPTLKRLIVSRLSTIPSTDAADYLLELLK